METLVIFGVEEDDETVNTIDTGKPRSLADVIYRSEYFAHLKEHDRAKISNIAANAIRLCGHRTGAWIDAFALRRTHGDFLDWLGRHGRLLEAARHIYEEDGGKITSLIGPGYATGLLYLMGNSASDRKVYLAHEPPDESALDWSQWDRACEFWVLLAQHAEDLKPLVDVLARRQDEDEDEDEDDRLSIAEKQALVVKAWNLFRQAQPVTTKAISLKDCYTKDEDGIEIFTDPPTLGGIDVGKPSEVEDEPESEDEESASMIKARAAEQIKLREAEAERAARAKKATTTTKAQGWKLGEIAWVAANGKSEEPWRGRLIKVAGTTATLKVESGFKGAGSQRSVPLTALKLTQPLG